MNNDWYEKNIKQSNNSSINFYDGGYFSLHFMKNVPKRISSKIYSKLRQSDMLRLFLNFAHLQKTLSHNQTELWCRTK